MTKVRINEKELEIISNKEFFILKKEVTQKISLLFSDLRDALVPAISESRFDFPDKTDLALGKLSKGENYLGFPYIILDFPKIFSKEDVFAFRTMFWWGHHISFHLQLAGISKEKYQEAILKNKSNPMYDTLKVGIGTNPFEYEMDGKDSVSLGDADPNHLRLLPYLRISSQLELIKWNEVPETGTIEFKRMLSLLKL